MQKIANKEAICEVLFEKAKKDKNIVVLCSDSRGSASLTPFAEAYPEQFVETGIAEQNLVGIAAGLASCKKKVFAASPASFLTTRSYEQIKVDVAYSGTNVTLIGISGGISYGALGMTHHSLQDIAAMSAIPNMRVYLPSDRHQTKCLVEAILEDEMPAYIRVGRHAVKDVYDEDASSFVLNQASVIGKGEDILLVACGEMVQRAVQAAKLLEKEQVYARVLDMYCLKPFDADTLTTYASCAKAVITIEEHSPFGGLGSMVSQIIAGVCPKRVISMALPDTPVITGTAEEVFDYYGLTAEGICSKAMELMKNV